MPAHASRLPWCTAAALAVFPGQRRTPRRGSRTTAGHPGRLPPVTVRLEEAAINGIHATSLAYAEGYVAEDDPLKAARLRAEEVGVRPVGNGAGAGLRLLAAATDARTVVEIGTGTGVSAIWLLRGMRAEGVLTSVDVEPEHQRLARQALSEAGFPPNRARLITGRATEVLPRLTDGAYDLVFCDAEKREYPDYLTEAARLLRPGGVVAFDNALWHDQVADPAQRDPDTVAIREVGRALLEDERFVPAMLPLGDGLLVATLRR